MNEKRGKGYYQLIDKYGEDLIKELQSKIESEIEAVLKTEDKNTNTKSFDTYEIF